MNQNKRKPFHTSRSNASRISVRRLRVWQMCRVRIWHQINVGVAVFSVVRWANPPDWASLLENNQRLLPMASVAPPVERHRWLSIRRRLAALPELLQVSEVAYEALHANISAWKASSYIPQRPFKTEVTYSINASSISLPHFSYVSLFNLSNLLLDLEPDWKLGRKKLEIVNLL